MGGGKEFSGLFSAHAFKQRMKSPAGSITVM
jgi:hypothetical protein